MERRTRLGLALLACLAGAAVLAHELLAAGWLAPLHGTGIDVWAAILSTSLLALAVGAWAGSRTAGRIRGLGPLLDATVLGALALAAGAVLVARSDPASPLPLLPAAALLLLPPLGAFGLLSPWLVERYAATGAGPGRAAGTTYAIGTLGSAAGALATGLLLVGELGLRRTTFGVAGALVLGGLAAALAAGAARRRALGWLVVGAAALAGLHTWGAEPARGPGPFGLSRVERRDGFYGRHEVWEDDVSRYLLVDGILQTSAPRFETAPSRAADLLRAGNALALAPWLRPRGRRALVVGVGGAALPAFLDAEGWDVEAVEIDPVVVDLARRHFGLRLPVVVADGRRFLARARTDYDLVVLDVYRGEHVPKHLFTEEAFASMRARLGPWDPLESTCRHASLSIL